LAANKKFCCTWQKNTEENTEAKQKYNKEGKEMEGSPKTCGNNQQVNLCAWHALRDSTNVNVYVFVGGFFGIFGFTLIFILKFSKV